MIDEQYIMKKLEIYASSPKGKERIKEVYGIEYVGSKERYAVYRKYGEQMKKILLRYLSSGNPNLKSIQAEDIVVGVPFVDSDGCVNIKVSFAEGSLHRASLNPKNPGVYDIVLLFERGYTASKYVYGEWNGRHVRSVKERQPNDFLERAIEEFNNNANGIASAKLVGAYA